MERYEACLGELEEMLKALNDAGLEEVIFSSPRGSLALRGAGCGEGSPEAKHRKDHESDGDTNGTGPAGLLLLRSTCVGRWSRTLEESGEDAVDKDTPLGIIATLLGEEGLKAPGPGRVEKWILGEGEVAGFGDPLALFREVL